LVFNNLYFKHSLHSFTFLNIHVNSPDLFELFVLHVMHIDLLIASNISVTIMEFDSPQWTFIFEHFHLFKLTLLVCSIHFLINSEWKVITCRNKNTIWLAVLYIPHFPWMIWNDLNTSITFYDLKLVISFTFPYFHFIVIITCSNILFINPTEIPKTTFSILILPFITIKKFDLYVVFIILALSLFVLIEHAF